jgi:DNA-binding CsgD family transcriptional regulator
MACLTEGAHAAHNLIAGSHPLAIRRDSAPPERHTRAMLKAFGGGILRQFTAPPQQHERFEKRWFPATACVNGLSKLNDLIHAELNARWQSFSATDGLWRRSKAMERTIEQITETNSSAPCNLECTTAVPPRSLAPARAASPAEVAEVKHLFFQFRSNDEFIREGQRQKIADLTAEHRRALVRLRKAVWQIAKETRLLEKIYASRAANAVAARNGGAHMQDWGKNTAADDHLPRTVVIQSAWNRGFDVALTVESRNNVVSQIAGKPALREAPAIPVTPAAPADLAPAPAGGLTGRQRDVLNLMIRGMSNKEIARALGLAEGTVKVHVSALFNKLGTHHRTAAAVIGAQLLSHMH